MIGGFYIETSRIVSCRRRQKESPRLVYNLPWPIKMDRVLSILTQKRHVGRIWFILVHPYNRVFGEGPDWPNPVHHKPGFKLTKLDTFWRYRMTKNGPFCWLRVRIDQNAPCLFYFDRNLTMFQWFPFSKNVSGDIHRFLRKLNIVWNYNSLKIYWLIQKVNWNWQILDWQERNHYQRKHIPMKLWRCGIDLLMFYLEGNDTQRFLNS